MGQSVDDPVYLLSHLIFDRSYLSSCIQGSHSRQVTHEAFEREINVLREVKEEMEVERDPDTSAEMPEPHHRPFGELQKIKEEMEVEEAFCNSMSAHAEKCAFNDASNWSGAELSSLVLSAQHTRQIEMQFLNEVKQEIVHMEMPSYCTDHDKLHSRECEVRDWPLEGVEKHLVGHKDSSWTGAQLKQSDDAVSEDGLADVKTSMQSDYCRLNQVSIQQPSILASMSANDIQGARPLYNFSSEWFKGTTGNEKWLNLARNGSTRNNEEQLFGATSDKIGVLNQQSLGPTFMYTSGSLSGTLAVQPNMSCSQKSEIIFEEANIARQAGVYLKERKHANSVKFTNHCSGTTDRRKPMPLKTSKSAINRKQWTSHKPNTPVSSEVVAFSK